MACQIIKGGVGGGGRLQRGPLALLNALLVDTAFVEIFAVQKFRVSNFRGALTLWPGLTKFKPHKM